MDDAGLSHGELAVLAREHMLAGHLIDRAGMPHVVGAYGLATMEAVAVEEWMAASPVYTRRTQELLGFGGDDVATIFKGMQLDIGAPHEFMDFRYRVSDDAHGEFWLDSCGALMDVEPMGDDFVVAMCHHIEDPTFDATAAACNPRARVRPVHRPPRAPADRHPHCRWTVVVDPDVDPLPMPPVATALAGSAAARLPVPEITGGNGDGFDDYTRPLDPDLRMEDFSSAALRAISDELCLQGHLLTMAFVAALEHHAGAETAAAVGRRQARGIAGVVASRLRRAFGLGDDQAAVAAVLRLHPAFRPSSYVRLQVDEGSGGGLLVSLHPCSALDEDRFRPWPLLWGADSAVPFDAIVQAVNPRARCEAGPAAGDAVCSWSITLDPRDEPWPEPDEVTLTRFSTGADFVFRAGTSGRGR